MSLLLLFNQSSGVPPLVPVITVQPQDTTIFKGLSASLSVTATNATSYQWYSGVSGDTTKSVTGATLSTLSIAPTSTITYWVRCSNVSGDTDSTAAKVTVLLPLDGDDEPALDRRKIRRRKEEEIILAAVQTFVRTLQ